MSENIQNTGNNHIPLDEGSYLNGQPYDPPSDKVFNIVYTFPKTTIVSSEVEKVDNNRIQLSYNTSHTYPNLTIQDYINYSAHKITISKLVHNIFPGITEDTNIDPEYKDTNGNNKIIGEMFIEHKPTANTGNHLFLCFLLMKSNSTVHSNDIDKLIQMTGTSDSFEDIWISNSIPKQINNPSAVTYNSKNHKIIVFLTPILINNESSNIIESFDTYDISDKFYGTFENLINDPSIAGNTRTYLLHDSRSVNKSTSEDKIYIKCHPTGASQEEINTYNVPVESEYTQQAQEIELKNASINLIFFSGALVLIYFFVPIVYFRSIYKTVLSMGNYTNSDSKAGIVRNIDNSIVVLFGILITFLMYSDIPNAMSYVIYAIFAIGVSILLIVNKKGSDPDWIQILDYDDNNIKHKFSGFAPQNIVDFIILFLAIIAYPFYDIYNSKVTYGVMAFWTIPLALYLFWNFLIMGRNKWTAIDTLYSVFIVYGVSLLLFSSGVSDRMI